MAVKRTFWLYLCTIFVHIARASALAINAPTDLYISYLMAQTWASGGDPYSFSSIRLLSPGGIFGLDVSQIPPIIAPISLPVLALFSWLPWSAILASFLLLATAASIIVSRELASLVPYRLTPVIFGCALLFNPVLAGIRVANLSAIAGCGTLLAVCPITDNRPVLRSVALTIGICLKFPIALPAVVFLLLRGQIHVVGIALGLSSVSVASSIACDRRILSRWLNAFSASLNSGQPNSSEPGNPNSHLSLTLEATLRFLGVDRNLALASGFIVFLVIFAIVVLQFRKWEIGFGLASLVGLQGLSAAALLPFYHWQHDAIILLPAIPATVALFESGKRSLAGINFGCLFFLGLPLAHFTVSHFPNWQWWIVKLAQHSQPLAVLGLAIVPCIFLLSKAGGSGPFAGCSSQENVRNSPWPHTSPMDDLL